MQFYPVAPNSEYVYFETDANTFRYKIKWCKFERVCSWCSSDVVPRGTASPRTSIITASASDLDVLALTSVLLVLQGTKF